MQTDCGAIRNLTVLTMDPARPVLSPGGILWEDGVVVLVGECGEVSRLAREKGIALEEGRGRLACPGLINTHGHLFQHLLKGKGTDQSLESWWPSVIGPAALLLDENMVRAAAAAGALEAIRSGTTTFLDYNYAHPCSGLSEAVIGAVRQTGLRLVYGRGYRNTGAQFSVAAGLVESLDSVFREVLDLRERYREDPLVEIWLAPSALWGLDQDGLRETRKLADRENLGLTMHMWETPTDEQVARERFGEDSALDVYRRTGFLEGQLLAVHGVCLGEPEMAAMEEHGTCLSHNPASNMILGSGTAPVPALTRRGVTVALGTDGAASGNTVSMLEAMKLATLLHKVSGRDPLALTARKAVEMATLEGARALGLEDRTGSLEAGKSADFFLADPGNHLTGCPVWDPWTSLVYALDSSCVDTVVIAGRTVLRDGKFDGNREEEALRDLKKEVRRLAGLLGEEGL